MADVILLKFSSTLPSTLSAKPADSSHLLSDEVYYDKQAPKLNHHSRIKANICCQADFKKGRGITVNTLI